jgi:hypothetical protein
LKGQFHFEQRNEINPGHLDETYYITSSAFKQFTTKCELIPLIAIVIGDKGVTQGLYSLFETYIMSKSPIEREFARSFYKLSRLSILIPIDQIYVNWIYRNIITFGYEFIKYYDELITNIYTDMIRNSEVASENQRYGYIRYATALSGFDFPEVDNLPNFECLKDDFDYALRPVNISEERLLIFRNTVRKFLDRIPPTKLKSENYFIKKAKAKASSVSNAMAFDCSSKDMSTEIFSNLQESLENRRNHSGWRYIRKLIPVGPENTRDAWIACPHTYEEQAIVESISEHLLRFQRRSCVGKPFSIEKVNKLGTCFLMADIKKFGISFPRELIRVFLEELSPHYNIIEGILENFKTLVYNSIDNLYYSVERGFGLGNLFFTSTLIYCLVQEILKFPSLCFHDDTVVAVPPSYQLDDRYEYLQLLEGYGFIINYDKVFISTVGFVFLENYVRGDRLLLKRSRLLAPLCEVLFSYNSFECKNKIRDYFNPEFIVNGYSHLLRQIIIDIVKFHGYEFSADELNLPVSLGGWFDQEDQEGLTRIPEQVIDAIENKVIGGVETTLPTKFQVMRNDKFPCHYMETNKLSCLATTPFEKFLYNEFVPNNTLNSIIQEDAHCVLLSKRSDQRFKHYRLRRLQRRRNAAFLRNIRSNRDEYSSVIEVIKDDFRGHRFPDKWIDWNTPKGVISKKTKILEYDLSLPDFEVHNDVELIKLFRKDSDNRLLSSYRDLRLNLRNANVRDYTAFAQTLPFTQYFLPYFYCMAEIITRRPNCKFFPHLDVRITDDLPVISDLLLSSPITNTWIPEDKNKPNILDPLLEDFPDIASAIQYLPDELIGEDNLAIKITDTPIEELPLWMRSLIQSKPSEITQEELTITEIPEIDIFYESEPELYSDEDQIIEDHVIDFSTHVDLDAIAYLEELGL